MSTDFGPSCHEMERRCYIERVHSVVCEVKVGGRAACQRHIVGICSHFDLY